MAASRYRTSIPTLQPDVVIEDATLEIGADVANFAGVDRLRVEALLAIGGPLIVNNDDDSIPGLQDLLTVINENYSFDGASWRRDQARAASSGIDEALMYKLSRAVASGLDTDQGAGTRVVPIGARAAVAAHAYAIQRLLVDSVQRGDDGLTYSAIAARGAVAAQAYGLMRGLGDVVVRGDDGATYSAVGTRAALAAQAYAIQRLLVDSVQRGDDGATYAAIAARGAVAAQAYALMRGLGDVAIRADDGATWSALQSRAAVADQAYAIQRLLTDSVTRGDDGVDYPAIGARAALAAQAYTLVRQLSDTVVRGDDGATYSAVGTRAALAAQAYAIQRLLVDSVQRGDDGATYAAIAARGAVAAQAYALMRGLGDVAIRADDGATWSALQSRAAVADQAYAIQRLLTDAVTRGDDGVDYPAIGARAALAAQAYTLVRQLSDTVVRGDDGATYSAVGTRAALAAQAYAIQRLLTDSVMRGDDGATYTAIAVRNFDAAADVDAALIGITANTRPAMFDVRAGAFGRNEGISFSVTTGQYAGSFTYQARESAFAAAVQGRRFYSTNPTLDTHIDAQADFVDTTPTLLLRQNASTVKVVLRSLTVVLFNTPTDIPRIILVLDTGDRFSAGGSAITPQNINEESATASATSVLLNPTATAAGAGARPICQSIMPRVESSFWSIDFKDGLIMGATSSFLAYISGNGGATAPDIFFIMEHEEAVI